MSITSQQLGDLREATGQKRVQKSDVPHDALVKDFHGKPFPKSDRSETVPLSDRLAELERKQNADGPTFRSFQCKLPLPPSVNGLYPTCRGRRVKSRDYKRWLERAEMDFLSCVLEDYFGKSVRFSGDVIVQYNFCFPHDNRRRDGENYCKAVSDFLVERGVIEDDSRIQEMTWKKSRTQNPYVLVEIESR
jgi:Holliday junction resolvase RusA-like endonuclease